MADDLRDTSAPPNVYTTRAQQSVTRAGLGDRRDADVAIIGAGFTGLSAALHLAQAGISAVVLEAQTVAWGASGRAFGQVVPYLKGDHQSILDHYGPALGPGIVDAVAAGPDVVFGLISNYGLECDQVRSGLLFAAFSPSGRRSLEARATYWQTRGAPIDLLDANASAAAIGTTAYSTALLDRRGGHLNPFAYAHGLAAAAIANGAQIHRACAVRSVRRENGRWRLDVGGCSVRAEVVIIATNAYTGELWPGLRESMVPMRGHGAVTMPLSDNLRAQILPGGQALTDTRRLFSGLRMLPGGRLHVSLDGPAFSAKGGPDLRQAQARVAKVFPALGPLRWEETWSGWIALTRDQFPRVHELAPRLYAGLGYSGRGIAAATLIGRDLAALARGAPEQERVFPLSPLKPLPLHRLAHLPARALLNAYRALDALDGRRFGTRKR